MGIKRIYPAGFNPNPATTTLEIFRTLGAARQEQASWAMARYHDDNLTDDQLFKLFKGQPFEAVHTQLGTRPTVVIFGGKEHSDDDGHLTNFLSWLAPTCALMGLSVVTGGGQGAMLMAAKASMKAREALLKSKWVAVFKPHVVSVPLYVSDEPLNPHYSLLTNAWFDLPNRTLAMLLVGHPMGCIAFPECGDGTMLEVYTVRSMSKSGLIEQTHTPFTNVMPKLTYIDRPEGKRSFWKPFVEFNEEMIGGPSSRVTRKSAEAAELKSGVIRANGRESVARVIDRVDAVAAAFYGMSLRDAFREMNGGVDVLDAASDLYPKVTQALAAKAC